MYYEMSVQFFVARLKVVRKLLETIQAQARLRNIPDENILALRLAPDMFHFCRQVQIVSDNAKGHSSRLAGIEAPKFEDTEKTFDDLLLRIDKTLEFLATFTPEHFANVESQRVELPYASFDGMYFMGPDYLKSYAIPNYMFHECMIYALARSNGFDIGKKDFFVDLPLHKKD